MSSSKELRQMLNNCPQISEFIRSEVEADIQRMESDMPYTEQQHKLFEAAAHDPEVAKRQDIPQATAERLAHEGVKKDNAACTDGLTNATPGKAIKVRFRKLIK